MRSNTCADTVEHMMHGGDHYGKEIELDFSVNTNPYADNMFEDEENSLFRAAYRAIKDAARYPDISCRKLRTALSELEHVPAEQIVCGNGASELFMAITHAVKPKTALLLSPCYSGYEHALRAVDCKIVRHLLSEENEFVPDESVLEAITEDIDLMFLTNPNNPTGRLVDPQLLEQIVERCKACGVILVLDACFMALTNMEPIRVKPDIIVNAFTKSMSIPAFRLGYLISENEELLSKIRLQIPEWSVSRVAQEVGCAAAEIMANTYFMILSMKYIEAERRFLAEGLASVGLKVYPSNSCFLLTKGKEGIYEALLEHKILARSCADYDGLGPEYLRFAVRTHEENEQLLTALKEIVKA